MKNNPDFAAARPEDRFLGNGSPASSRGGTLLSLVVVMLALGVMGVSLLTLTQTSHHSEMSVNSNARAQFLAESGLRFAQDVYCNQGWLHGRERTLHLASGDQVDIVRVANRFYAVGIASPGTPMEARARVHIPLSLCGRDPEIPPGEEFAIKGSSGVVVVGQRTAIEGDVAILDDSITIQGDVIGNVHAVNVDLKGGFVDGEIYARGDVGVGPGIVTGDVHAGGSVSMTSSGSAGSTIYGHVFAVDDVSIGGGASIEGTIHSCEGDVYIGGNGTNTHSVYAAGDVYLSGSATVTGEVQAGGKIVITGSAKIVGDAYAGGEISAAETAITGKREEYYPYPKPPICPNLADLEDLELPEKTTFTATGSDYISNLVGPHLLSPGNYGDLKLPKDAELYLRPDSNGHGNYFFKNIEIGTQAKIFLDLSGSGDIRIFVTGNVEIESQLRIFASPPGSLNYYPVFHTNANGDKVPHANVAKELAAKVYLEAHGSYNLKQRSEWFGSVYTPEGTLRVGNDSDLIGAFYSGGGHEISGSRVIHVAPNYFNVQP